MDVTAAPCRAEPPADFRRRLDSPERTPAATQGKLPRLLDRWPGRGRLHPTGRQRVAAAAASAHCSSRRHRCFVASFPGDGGGMRLRRAALSGRAQAPSSRNEVEWSEQDYVSGLGGRVTAPSNGLVGGIRRREEGPSIPDTPAAQERTMRVKHTLMRAVRREVNWIQAAENAAGRRRTRRRAEAMTCTSILSNSSRSVATCARARAVPPPVRRSSCSRTYAVAASNTRSWWAMSVEPRDQAEPAIGRLEQHRAAVGLALGTSKVAVSGRSKRSGNNRHGVVVGWRTRRPPSVEVGCIDTAFLPHGGLRVDYDS